jgi:DNA/RNA-binding domain of Phe-tRNA-synthetase-like protein
MERGRRYRIELARTDVLAAAAVIEGIEVRPSSPALVARLETLYRDLQEGRAGGSETNRAAIRDLLRNGRFRPSGRSKPAQEYLARMFAQNGRLDLINNAVDVNNYVSLEHGLPLSAFAEEELSGDLVLRLGAPGERYVFNASGQELDCEDLLVVCDDGGPIGSPVKDSQRTKVFEGARSVLYVVYASATTTTPEALLTLSTELGVLMAGECPGAVAWEPLPFETT